MPAGALEGAHLASPDETRAYRSLREPTWPPLMKRDTEPEVGAVFRLTLVFPRIALDNLTRGTDIAPKRLIWHRDMHARVYFAFPTRTQKKKLAAWSNYNIIPGQSKLQRHILSNFGESSSLTQLTVSNFNGI